MCPKGWVMRFCLRLFCSYFILFSFYWIFILVFFLFKPIEFYGILC
jgi:hypothetical protein